MENVTADESTMFHCVSLLKENRAVRGSCTAITHTLPSAARPSETRSNNTDWQFFFQHGLLIVKFGSLFPPSSLYSLFRNVLRIHAALR
jgi:hypothetical protein